MVLLQIVAKYLPGGDASKRQKPGVTRGDLVLEEDSLPSQLAGWRRMRFVAAPHPEELPEGQYWWVHRWDYARENFTAIVSFDQLGENQWHELTYCYRNQDWSIEDRTLFVESEKSAAYAVARLRRGSDEYAILVFSVFFEDGSWAAPPDVNLPLMNRANLRDPSLSDKVQMKFDPLIVFPDQNSGHTRALQCQCLVVGSTSFTQPAIDATVRLHLESRQRLRQHWLDHAQTQPTGPEADGSPRALTQTP
jgi:hypothetical protein